MICNVGKTDRILRIFFAVVLAFVAYLTSTWWVYLIAGLLLLTAITGFCGPYVLFKINTCKKK